MGIFNISLVWLLIGIAVTIFIYQIGIGLIKKFFNNTRRIVGYWIFVSIFVILNVIAYYIIFRLNITNRADVIAVANQASGLVFAIFTGYFAFSEIMEGRFEKLNTEALNLYRGGSYTDAIKMWEDALAIKKHHFDAMGNLTEAYIIVGEYSKAEDKIAILKKIAPPEKRIVTPILMTMMRLFQTHIAEADKAMADVVEEMKTIDRRNYYPRWDFTDANSSAEYTKLSGEVKTRYDNLSRYINNILTDDERVRFEAGNYLLEPQVSSQSL